MQIGFVSTAIAFVLFGCATLEPPSFEGFSRACEKSDIPSCMKAADLVFNLSWKDLKPCTPNQEFCTKPGESQQLAKARLDAKAVEQYATACDVGKNAEACLRAGSSLAIESSGMPINEYKPVAAKAEAFFEKACKLGSQSGCRFRGTTHRAGA